MRGRRAKVLGTVGLALLLIALAAILAWRATRPVRDPNKPALWIIGDSTVKSGKRGYVGWGDKIAPYFDASKIQVFNEAVPGKSSRTFYTDKWAKVHRQLLPGDFVVIQFGHNDSAPIDDAKAKGTMSGVGAQEREIFNSRTHKRETLYTFGGYLRLFIEETRNRGATPILCTYVPMLPPQRESPYAIWTREVAAKEQVQLVDLFSLVSDAYKKLAPADVKNRYFVPRDRIHTNEAGAELNAAKAAEGFRATELAEFMK